MKEEMYEKFANKALAYLESTEAFLKDQLPDYFQQVVTYYAFQSWLYVAAGALATLASSYLIKKGIEILKEGEEAGIGLVMVGGFAIIVIPIIVMVNPLPSALKATLAPKVFIVDYLRGKE